MSLLFRIVYAAHANGTHHKLALDALSSLEGAEADAWRRLFLKHAALYMQGAKAPDDDFKDFQNHVLHVRDGYWGGALEAVETWYGKVVDALKAGAWTDAVFAAGVLSHYATDPLHPFHTGQSEAESCIHRACEWSISRAYLELRAQAERDLGLVRVTAGEEPAWLRHLIVEGAELANHSYEKLIAHYDINRGAVDPPAGLDTVGRRIVGELILRASGTVAAVLDRAFVEAAVQPPEVTLTVETVLAALQIPAKLLAKRLTDAEDRRVVLAMFDELKATGTVEETLPADDRMVRDLHRAQVQAAQLSQRLESRAKVLMRTVAPVQVAPPTTAPVARDAVAAPANVVPISTATPAKPRAGLGLSDDVERAPSIGPKTAERLYGAGIRSVAELLAANAEAVAGRLGVRHITPGLVRSWQDQTRLVVEIPGLRGTHAQLLVGAGYSTKEALSAAGPEKLCADVLAFAATADGQHILREGAPPDIELVKRWLTSVPAASTG